MIETGLVYIYSISPAHVFKGCGALLEGGYVATCRHVWRTAIVSENGETDEVAIEFPFAQGQDTSAAHKATLADACEEPEAALPDLVLLKPDRIPSDLYPLPPATKDQFETGAGFAWAVLRGRDKANPNRVRQVQVKGEIGGYINSDGQRQFTGSNSAAYWTDRGTSGSPVFIQGGQQLAGIVALSEVGANEGESGRREAFVVPGTVIRKYLTRRLAADAEAKKRDIDPARLQPILSKLGLMDVPDDKIAESLEVAVEDIFAQSCEAVPRSNDGADIETAIAKSRAKLGALDTAGALEVLQAKIGEEEHQRSRRLVPLLKERAEVERLAFEYDAAMQTLADVTRLAPDDVWAFIGLGDLYRKMEAFEEAAKAYRNAEAAARRQGDERKRSVAFSMIGDIQMKQRDPEGALKCYGDSLDIRKRLAKSDPDNTLWQRDLSVSHERVGDVQFAQGHLVEALKSYNDGLLIRRHLVESDPGNAGWQRDLSVSFNKVGDVQMAQSGFEGALNSYQDSLDIIDRLAKSEPGHPEWQRDLSVSHERIGDVQGAQGHLVEALKSYNDGLLIRRHLVEFDPRNANRQRDLSVSVNKVGDVQMAQGDHAAALKSYQDGLNIIVDQLAKSDPGYAEWQCLPVSLNAVGDALVGLSVSLNADGDALAARGNRLGALESYQKRLTIAGRLAMSDPGNAEWQRDLWALFNKVGDLQREHSDRAGALKSYQEGLAIVDRLAKSDPGNAMWQRDLSVSFNKIGDVQMAQGGFEGALNSYQYGLDIINHLANTGPDNAGWRRERLAFFKKIDKAVAARKERLNAPESSDGNAVFIKLLAKSDPYIGAFPPPIKNPLHKHGWYSPPQQQSFEDLC